MTRYDRILADRNSGRNLSLRMSLIFSTFVVFFYEKNPRRFKSALTRKVVISPRWKALFCDIFVSLNEQIVANAIHFVVTYVGSALIAYKHDEHSRSAAKACIPMWTISCTYTHRILLSHRTNIFWYYTFQMSLAYIYSRKQSDYLMATRLSLFKFLPKTMRISPRCIL